MQKLLTKTFFRQAFIFLLAISVCFATLFALADYASSHPDANALVSGAARLADLVFNI